MCLGLDPSVLGHIKDDAISLVIWQRRLPRGLRDDLRRWAASDPPRFEARVEHDDDWIESALASFPRSPARALLVADVAQLVSRFRQLTSSTSVKISFGTVRDDQCRKFHADYQRLRLITTYLGPGTEWLPEPAIRREALVEPPACPTSANQLIVKDSALVQRAHSGDVLVLRGHDGVRAGGLAAIHRSPPIERSGKARVVLVASV